MLQRFPVVIEVLGPSGSGKSTILHAAKACLNEKGWKTPDYKNDRQRLNESPLYGKNIVNDYARRDFIRLCFEIAMRCQWEPSQALAAINMLRDSSHADAIHRQDIDGLPIIHDELLLHRAFSLLPRSKFWATDSYRFFARVPLPTAAIVVKSDVDENLRRLQGRGYTNVTNGLFPQELREVVERSQHIAVLASRLLRERGLPVLEIDSRQPVEIAVQQLLKFVRQVRHELEIEPPQDYLRRQIIQVSGSFHSRGRRHIMQTQGVAYASFKVAGMTLHPDDAQRDTRMRLSDFGVTRLDVEGKRVLDIGCGTGSVIFELCNLGIKFGYGLEIDVEKVNVARQIRNYLGLSQVTFDVADVETMPMGALPKFDITFALAIEGHIVDKVRFYRILGEMTRDRVYLETNGGADVEQVRKFLIEQGFIRIEDRGFCNDDRDPRNNKRRLLVASREGGA